MDSSRPSFQQPHDPESNLIANGWIEQFRRSKMRTVWKEVLASLVEGRHEGEETTLWIQRESINPTTLQSELEPLHQIPVKVIESIELKEETTDHQFHLKIYNQADDEGLVFRCVEDPVDALRWVQILKKYANAAKSGKKAVEEKKETYQAPDLLDGPTPQPQHHSSGGSVNSNTSSMTIRELRAICHGAGVNTAGMERGQLERAAQDVMSRGTYFAPPNGGGQPQQQQQHYTPPYPHAPAPSSAQSWGSHTSAPAPPSAPRLSVKELRAICHGAGINTAGMERSELERAAEDVQKRGTYFAPPHQPASSGGYVPPAHDNRQQEEEQRRRREEEQRRKAEENARRRAQEDARRKAQQLERQRRAEEEARREEEDRRRAQEEARRKAQEQERRRRAEEEARRRAEEEARRRAQEEARRRAEEEARRRAQEEARRQAQEMERRRKAEEEARRRAAEEEARRRAAEQQRQQHEAQLRYQQQQAAWKKQQEETERQRQQAAWKKQQEEAERKRQEAAKGRQQQWGGNPNHHQQQWNQQQQRPPPQTGPFAGWQQQPPPQQQYRPQQAPRSGGAPPPQQPRPNNNPTSPASQKYAAMANQNEDKSQATITRIKHDLLIQWALQPPQLQMLKPINALITTIHTVFPPALGVSGHAYFQRWKPIVPADLNGTNGLPDDDKLKKAVRKIRFFLHPDKLPRDLNEEQQFMTKMLWDVTSDAWEEHQKRKEEIGWAR